MRCINTVDAVGAGIILLPFLMVKIFRSNLPRGFTSIIVLPTHLLGTAISNMENSLSSSI